MYTIRITPQARNQLKAIAKLHRKALAQAIDGLKEDPFMGKPLTRELSGKFSLKIHIYRIIYIINEDKEIVTILSAGHRATVY